MFMLYVTERRNSNIIKEVYVFIGMLSIIMSSLCNYVFSMILLIQNLTSLFTERGQVIEGYYWLSEASLAIIYRLWDNYGLVCSRCIIYGNNVLSLRNYFVSIGGS